MSNYPDKFCPICTHKRRRELDSEIIYHVESNKDERTILRELAVFCAEKEIQIVLDERVLATHLKSHALVGVIGVSNVRGGGVIRLPSGEKIDVNDTKSVLRTLLTYGMANALEHSEEITIAKTLRIAELLLRPDPNQKDNEMEELKAMILGRMQEKQPKLNPAEHPYSAPTNVGKMPVDGESPKS